MRAWDLESFSTVCLLEGAENNVSTVAMSPDGRQVASGGVDAVLRVHDLRSQKILRSLSGHEAEVTSLAFTPDGRYLVSASRDKTVRLWDLRTGGCVRTLSLASAVLQVVVSSDGTRLVWVINPKLQRATVYRPDGSARVLQAQDTLDGENVLPGFTCPLADIV